ncbi:MAG: LysE family translocator [Thalassobaculales bacterium]
MELLPVLAGLAVMHLTMAMLPGPNTVLVSHLSAARSRREGLMAALGVCLGSAAWAAFSLAGVGVLLLEAGWLYRALRMAGAAYLIYVGVRMVWAGLHAGADHGRPPALPGRLGRAPVLAGLATTFSNPKSAVFWTSLFIVAVPPQAPAWFLAALLAVVTVQSLAWYALLALVLSTGPARGLYARAGRWLDVLAGVAMAGLGLRLAEGLRREMWRQG